MIVFNVAFNNCGEGFVLQQAPSGNSVLFSRAAGQTCEDALLKVYQGTYHPFLSQTCNNCHVNGPGIGTFASSDVQLSFNSFYAIGVNKISSQATNNSHKPPYTGSQNTDRMNELQSYWSTAQVQYASCVSESGGGSLQSVVKTIDKTVAATLSTTFVRIEWDLETESNVKIPLIAGIDIRKAVLNKLTEGYEFRNPTLRLKRANAGTYQSRALNLYINGQLQTEVTTYSNIDLSVSSTMDVNLAPGYANGYAVLTPANSDVIALEFSSLKSASNAPPPSMGTTVKYSQLTAAGGIFANSCVGCHNATNLGGALDLTNYIAAKTARAIIRSRINNAMNPMPIGGLLPQAQRDIINAWVDQGAPQ
ncbi:MAG TPA: cytochrome c [Pseudobdellovibrionaceae bacterium]